MKRDSRAPLIVAIVLLLFREFQGTRCEPAFEHQNHGDRAFRLGVDRGKRGCPPNFARCTGDMLSHTRTLSSTSETSCVPSKLKAALYALSLFPLRTINSRPVAVSHTRTVLSCEAVTTLRPSGLNAADQIVSSCPRSRAVSTPLKAFHTLAVLSIDAVTTLVPSGLNSAE